MRGDPEQKTWQIVGGRESTARRRNRAVLPSPSVNLRTAGDGMKPQAGWLEGGPGPQARQTRVQLCFAAFLPVTQVKQPPSASRVPIIQMGIKGTPLSIWMNLIRD